jgi:hypothetical protein
MPSIIIFPTHINDFNINANTNEQISKVKIDWSEVPYDSLSLSTTLNMQCKINLFNLEKIKDYCNNPNSKLELYNSIIEFKTDESKTCKLFENIYNDFLEVMSRDHDIFNGMTSIMPNAVVLLDDNDQYIGHTYVWIFEHRIYSMGIRNNVETQFLKHSKNNSKFYNVSAYLLEGVRRFTLNHGDNTFNIISPLDKMKTILIDKFGFKLNSMAPKGCYIFEPESTTSVLYYPENLRIPFIENIIYDEIKE